MIRLPRVLGLLICEKLGRDPQTGKPSLLGVMNSLTCASFPSDGRNLTAYAVLYGGTGEGTIQLGVQRLETESDVYSYSRWFRFPGRQTLVNLEIRINGIVFPVKGRYSFRLRFDDHDLTERYLDVFPERP
jgi:hypothetical protein